jgi:acetate kinase
MPLISNGDTVFIINCGSSSIKFALYAMEANPARYLRGEIAGIGTNAATFNAQDFVSNQQSNFNIHAINLYQAADYLVDWFSRQNAFASIKAIAHRIVHGMHHAEPEMISAELLVELKAISAYDPDHLPAEINLVERFKTRFPEMPQVACFDTSFHSSMPPVAKLLPIPRRFVAKGVQRYGFHGLSCTYLIGELDRLAGKEAAHGKVILAHLGSGASVTAVKDGKSMDTSMGFTPASGLVMSTRTGDLDPGVAWYLMQFEKLKGEEFNNLINHQSGLLGVSETSGDMRQLLQIEKNDNRSAEAIELFCYQTRKWIGSLATVIGGIDTLVFSGGIGEKSTVIRQRICDSLEFLGVELDATKNEAHENIISSAGSRVCARVIQTNEELVMAKLATGVLNNLSKK